LFYNELFLTTEKVGFLLSSVVEPEPQEPKLFVLAEPEPECIKVPVSEPDLDPDPTQNGIKKSKNPKGEANILGNNTASVKVSVRIHNLNTDRLV
jgi:hypothetical protein